MNQLACDSWRDEPRFGVSEHAFTRRDEMSEERDGDAETARRLSSDMCSFALEDILFIPNTENTNKINRFMTSVHQATVFASLINHTNLVSSILSLSFLTLPHLENKCHSSKRCHCRNFLWNNVISAIFADTSASVIQIFPCTTELANSQKLLQSCECDMWFSPKMPTGSTSTTVNTK